MIITMVLLHREDQRVLDLHLEGLDLLAVADIVATILLDKNLSIEAILHRRLERIVREEWKWLEPEHQIVGLLINDYNIII